ncbi:hypothetical protein ABZP36_012457 [Zizania latifolia]
MTLHAAASAGGLPPAASVCCVGALPQLHRCPLPQLRQRPPPVPPLDLALSPRTTLSPLAPLALSPPAPPTPSPAPPEPFPALLVPPDPPAIGVLPPRCPASLIMMKMGIERHLMEKIPQIVAIEPISDEETGLELSEEDIEKISGGDRYWRTIQLFLNQYAPEVQSCDASCKSEIADDGKTGDSRDAAGPNGNEPSNSYCVARSMEPGNKRRENGDYVVPAGSTPNPMMNGTVVYHSNEPLPAFKEVSDSEKQNSFVRKVNLCCAVYDFTDPTRNLKEKETKRQTLMELVDYVTSANGKFSCQQSSFKI